MDQLPGRPLGLIAPPVVRRRAGDVDVAGNPVAVLRPTPRSWRSVGSRLAARNPTLFLRQTVLLRGITADDRTKEQRMRNSPRRTIRYQFDAGLECQQRLLDSLLVALGRGGESSRSSTKAD